MPHIIIDYSANLEDRTDMAGFCDCLRAAACQIDAFPDAGVRVRAHRADHWAIADGKADYAYVHLIVRLRGGRELATRQAAVAALFEAAKGWLDPVMASSALALSLEMVDIDPQLSPKTGSIRAYMSQDKGAGDVTAG